jgi:hypothetical protein
MIWFLNIAINIAIVGFSVVGLPAALVAAAIYDWQKGKRLKAAGWKVDERDALDNALTVLIWFFAVAAWVVSWGVVALGAWSEPYLGWLIGGSPLTTVRKLKIRWGLHLLLVRVFPLHGALRSLRPPGTIRSSEC